MRAFSVLPAMIALSACAVVPSVEGPPRTPPPATTPAPVTQNPPAPVWPTPSLRAGAEAVSALDAGLYRGPDIGALLASAGYDTVREGEADAARRSFIESCPALLSRSDSSGIAADWTRACAAAPDYAGSAPRFFREFFETAIVGGNDGFVTGYFEPRIAGVRNRQPGFDVPVYGMPTDLVAQADYRGGGRAPLGRYEDGRFVPYFERAEIVAGALDGRAPVIAWVADDIDFFFLQIQGSGQLIAPDGSVLRIGYAGQNGRGYTAIGRTLRERGVFAPGEATMQGIVDWLRANPGEADAVMNENQSWVFFRELTGDGPLGALGVPVRPRVSVAADPRFTPLGAPVWIDAANDRADGLWIAQDTGGAIKGAGRFDTFWGAGEMAKATAGAMSSEARTLLLLPKGTLARIAPR
ncbi:murein transglycosylase A [Croceicoccus hydrothermalis]|uniref:murein transglycosylase A n=1 Tax=Croceicoccus hydrothermalis TaxID=2867964 RepID=UPI001EFADBF9|nr:murein transglycosylase A [Croceicoccus hydrothermalis]